MNETSFTNVYNPQTCILSPTVFILNVLESYTGGNKLKTLHGRLIVKFIDDKFIPSTIKGNIHFSSYEYFKKLEEGSNDKGKKDNKENAEFIKVYSNNHALLMRVVPEGSKPLGPNDTTGAFSVPFKSIAWITSYPDEDKEYGISSFAVIDPDKDMENGKIKDSFINDVSEISNNRRVLVFSEGDLRKSLDDFATENNKTPHMLYDDVEYTDDNRGNRNGLQKDLKYARQHEWRIRINMDILDNNGNIFLPGLDIGLVRDLSEI